MTSSTLQISRAREVADADGLLKAGDFYIRNIPLYNSDKVIHAVILKCPYCSMEMASTGIHKITISRIGRFLSRFRFPAGVTVTPKLQCPYNPHHIFSITRGSIKPTK